MSTTPELDKLRAAVQAGSDKIGAFLDWLDQHHYVIAEWKNPVYDIEPKVLVRNQHDDKYHRVTRKLPHDVPGTDTPGLCGAEPQPYNVDDQITNGRWYGQLSSGGTANDLCPECERRYAFEPWEQREGKTPQLFGTHKSINDWLADYYGIDMNAVERERIAILEQVRANNAL